MSNPFGYQAPPPGQYPQYPPGQYPPPGQFPPGQFPPGQFPPGQYPPQQYPPQQYPPQQYPPQQYPPQQYPPQQYPPQQYPPQQYPPQQFPPQQYPPAPGYQAGYAPQPQGFGAPQFAPGYAAAPQQAATGFVVSQNDYTADAEMLHAAMKGAGTDEGKLIAILGTRQRHELHLIDLAYRAKFGKQLADKIKSETSGHFGRVLVNIVQRPEYTDATYLYESMKGAGTDERILNEILATRDGAEMDKIKMAFVELFHTGTEKAIKGDSSGKHENLLLALHNGPRGKGETFVDQNRAAADAQKLYEQPNDTNFTFIFGNASHAHILAIRENFQSRYGKSLIDVIKKQFSGSFEDLLVVLATPRAEYFADRAHAAMKGMGTDDDALIRVISTRHGIDLPEIKKVFLQKYNKPLFEAVRSETSGDYRSILLEIIGSGP